MIDIIDKSTGEVIEFRNTLEAWEYSQNAEKLAKAIKDKVRPLIEKEMGGANKLVVGSKVFTSSETYARTFDMKALKEAVIDEDLFQSLLKPDNKLIKTKIKELMSSEPEIAMAMARCEVLDTDEFGNSKVTYRLTLTKF
jgi:hypothetical protein